MRNAGGEDGMASIIIAFPKVEDAKMMKSLLIRNGYEVNAICNTGAQVVSIANELDEGIVLCGYRLADMHYLQLHNYLPKGFEMLLIASPSKLSFVTMDNIMCLSSPIKPTDVLSTVHTMLLSMERSRKRRRRNPVHRSDEERETIAKAKQLLMDRNHMSEEEAHRYIQKTSMDNGTGMVETAQMLLALM